MNLYKMRKLIFNTNYPIVFIPGASILITAIVTVANKKGINILPSSFASDSEKQIEKKL